MTNKTADQELTPAQVCEASSEVVELLTKAFDPVNYTLYDIIVILGHAIGHLIAGEPGARMAQAHFLLQHEIIRTINNGKIADQMAEADRASATKTTGLGEKGYEDPMDFLRRTAGKPH
jgi:hypothetical protein